MSKTTASVVATKIGDTWQIRGYTRPYVDILRANGCAWDGKKLAWEYVGAGLPDEIQQLVDGTYGLNENSPLPELNKGNLENQVSQAETTSGRAKRPYSRKTAGVFEKGAPVEWDSPSGIVCGEYLKPEDATRSRVLLGSAELVIHNAMLRRVMLANPIVIVDMEQIQGDEAILRKQADTLANELGYSLVASVSRDDPNLAQALAEVFAVAMGRKPIVHTEPDGTCPYMIENQRDLKPGQDWLGWMTCCECGVFLDLESNRKAGSKPLMGVGNGKVICRNCHAAKYNLPEIQLDTPTLKLPLRQVEFLLALANGKPVVKNAATRKALRTHKLITDTDDWAAIELTAAGEWWIGLNRPTSPAKDDRAETDTWVKQVNEAARAADAAFTESMYTLPVVHLAAEDPDVQKANDSFVKVASGGKFKSVDEFIPPKPAFGTKSRVTPLRQQYLDIKAQYPDFILWFRLGDFYETFDDDAETAARELDLVLTGRPVSRDERVPMAGVPHHALDQYVNQLVEKGYKVAIAEQMSEPNGHGIVERKVTRTLEPQVRLKGDSSGEMWWIDEGDNIFRTEEENQVIDLCAIARGPFDSQQEAEFVLRNGNLSEIQG